MVKKLQTENNIIMRGASLIWTLFLLNFLTLLCSLPVVTIGPALTAMHDGLIRYLRKEDGYIAKRYFSVFKENLKQGIILWLPFLFIFLGAGADFLIQILAPGMLPKYIMIPAGVAGLLAMYFFQWLFPVQARFEGGTIQKFKMTFLLAGVRFPRTIAMTMMWIIPILGTKYLFTLPLVLVFGISLPALLCALFYFPVFRELEGEEEDQTRKS